MGLSRYNLTMQAGTRTALTLAAIFFFLTSLGVYAYAQKPGSNETNSNAKPGKAASDNGETTALLPSDLQTRETFERSESQSRPLSPGVGDYLKVFVGLFVVIGVIWGLSLLMKKLLVVKGVAGPTESLKVLHTLSLTPNRMLYLVRLSDRILLIGASEGGLRTLAEITDPGEVSEILRELEFKGNFEKNPFRERLASLLSSSAAEEGLNENLESSHRKIKSALDRLKHAGQRDEE